MRRFSQAYAPLYALGPIFLIAALLFVVELLSGCAVGPDYARRDPKAPAGYASQESRPEAIPPAERAAIEAAWWRSFDDPVLNELIGQGETANTDLKAAAARLRRARAERGQAVAAFLPEGGASASAQRQQRAVTEQERRLSAQVPGIGGAGQGDRIGEAWQAGFDASWEIDIFGGLRRGLEAATADLQAADASLGDALVSVRAEIARNYLEARSGQRRLAIARKNVAARKDSLELTERRFKAGLTSGLDVERARGELESAQAVVPSLDRGYRSAAFRLATLTAAEPGGILTRLDSTAPDKLPLPTDLTTPGKVLGLPSELLLRRPDLRAAERGVAAATARVGVATAELFPKVSLTGAFGYQSTKAGELTLDRNTFWNFGPALRWNILNVKRITDGIEAARAGTDEALAVYEGRALAAVEEAETALTALSREQSRTESLGRSVAANRSSVGLAEQRYKGGLESFLTVLDAQSALYAAEDQQAVSELAQAQAVVAVYKAAGGGWAADSAGLGGLAHAGQPGVK